MRNKRKLNIYLNPRNLLRRLRITSKPSAFNFWWKSIQIPINLRAIRFSACNEEESMDEEIRSSAFFSVGNISCERDSKDVVKKFSSFFHLF